MVKKIPRAVTVTMRKVTSRDNKSHSQNQYKDKIERIGKLYLYKDFISRDKLIVQLAKSIDDLSDGGYKTIATPVKETKKKVRFVEELSQAGELGDIYVSKEVLKYLCINKNEPIAVRISTEEIQEDAMAE